MVFVQHILNAIMAALNLTPLPNKFCTCFGAWVFGLIEFTTFAYLQVIYFKSMPCEDDMGYQNCRKTHTGLYLWSMSNILYFYLGFAVAICYLLRSYCYDAELEEAEREEEK